MRRSLTYKAITLFAVTAAIVLSGCSFPENDPEWIRIMNGPRNPYIHKLYPNSEVKEIRIGQEYSYDDIFVVDVEEDKTSVEITAIIAQPVDDEEEMTITLSEDSTSFTVEEGEGDIIVYIRASTPDVTYDDRCSVKLKIVEEE